MLNFRYHLVSLTAVFLALGLGVLVGTTLTDQAVVRALQVRLQGSAEHSRTLEANVERLQADLAIWERFGEGLLPALAEGLLAGRRVLLVAQEGTDPALLAAAEEGIGLAGGEAYGRIFATEALALDDEFTRDRLALILEADSADASMLLQETAERLAARILPADPPPPMPQGEAPAEGTGDAADPDPAAQPQQQEEDLLQVLGGARLLSLDGVGLTDLPVAGLAVVLLGPSADAGGPPIEDFLLPLARRLAEQIPVAGAQPREIGGSLVEGIRAVPRLAESVATVDHLDTAPGRLSLVHALADLARGNPAAHYGIGRGARRVAPPPGD